MPASSSSKASSPNRPTRRIAPAAARSWLKSKCGFEQEFVIIGWRPSNKAGRPFSSLLLAVREGEQFRYAGRVGTGYSGAGLDDLVATIQGAGAQDAAGRRMCRREIARARAFRRAEAGRRDRVSRLDPRRPGAAGLVQGAALRQARGRNREGDADADTQSGEGREANGRARKPKPRRSGKPRQSRSSRDAMAPRRSTAFASPIPTRCCSRRRTSPSAN